MARVLVMDVLSEENRVYTAQVNDLKDYYEHLKCDCFDIANRKVGNKRFDIYVDDIGLYRDNLIVSAIDNENQPMLVGNLIFANHDSEGNTTSLSDEDIAEITENIYLCVAKVDGAEEHKNLVVKADY